MISSSTFEICIFLCMYTHACTHVHNLTTLTATTVKGENPSRLPQFFVRLHATQRLVSNNNMNTDYNNNMRDLSLTIIFHCLT